MLAAALAGGQSIVGDWHGSVEIPNDAPLRLALHVARDAGGTLRATIDSLDEGGSGLPVDSIEVRESRVRFEMKSVAGVYQGTVAAGGSRLTGLWRQDGKDSPLVWEPGDDPLSVSHPLQPEQAVERGRKNVRDFYDGKTAAVWDQMGPVLRQRLGAETALAAMFDRLRQQFGTERAVISETTGSADALRIYRRIARFEKSEAPVEILISFDPRGAIADFDF